MTTPGFDIAELVPSRWKAWVAAFSTFLGFAVPYLLTVTTSLPQPWPAVIGVVITGLSWLGVYRAPFKPTSTDAVLVHPSQVQSPSPTLIPGLDASKIKAGWFPPSETPSIPADGYENPWRPQP